MKQLDIYSSQIQRVYLALEDEIISMLIKRLNDKSLTNSNFNIYTWYLDKLNQLGSLNKQTVDLIAQSTKVNKPLLEKMIVASGFQIADETNASLSSGLSADVQPISSNIDTVLRNTLKQTFLDLDNYVNQTLVTTNTGVGAVTMAYQSILENMVANVTTGTKTAKQALNSSIYDLIDKGVKSGFVDKGGHRWSVETYAKTVLDSTKYRVMNETRMEQAHEYDVHTFVMSSHPASRAACAPIQGKVVSDVPVDSSKYDSDYPSIYSYGYGEPSGCFGINCHHMKYPFIPGVNTNHQVQYDPVEAVENGKIQQKQRQLERSIRNNKRKMNAANELGDKEGVDHFKLKIRAQQGALRQLVNNHDFLHRDYSREKSYTKISQEDIKSILGRSKINKNIFNRHIRGTYEYDEKTRIRVSKGLKSASWLTISPEEGQMLINTYGVKDSRTRATYFKHNSIIGTFVDQKSGKELPTIFGSITYSKTGAHITPLDPRKAE